MQKEFNILLSRTDSIGDVVLTLPMAGLIKKHFPNCHIFFLGRTYTKSVIELSAHVDAFINYDDILAVGKSQQVELIKQLKIDTAVHVFPVKEIAQLMKAAGIINRVGTRNRLYHWFTCNRLLNVSRKKSDLHESQLNLQLLSFLGIQTNYAFKEIESFYGIKQVPALGNELFVNMLDKTKTKVILHPKSKGSAREWGLENFSILIKQLPKEKYQVFISGTKEDGLQLEAFIKANDTVVDLTGKLSLNEFISFINMCDVLVAASTGPLHIAAALGVKAIGLFAPMRPIHPGRWKPVGKDAHYVVIDKNCSDCRKGGSCACIEAIEVQKVVNLIEGK
jgi:heptosyltransferase-3